MLLGGPVFFFKVDLNSVFAVMEFVLPPLLSVKYFLLRTWVVGYSFPRSPLLHFLQSTEMKFPPLHIPTSLGALNFHAK